MRRAQERRESSSHPRPLGQPEILIAVGAFLAASALNVLAVATDLQAFAAVATPILFCWLVLCWFCSAGLFLAVAARRRGVDVPFYFRGLLVLGALAGLFTISPAIRVLTKNDAGADQPVAGTNLDLRNRRVEDESFAGRVLRHSDFSGATLVHVDLTGADLSESDFRNATFKDVDLSGAKLCGGDIRGADLRGARGLNAVADWSYVFFDGLTRFPRSQGYLLVGAPGPVEDTGRDLLYMCGDGQVRRIKA